MNPPLIHPHVARAYQADRIPRLRQLGRIGGLEHLDDLGQAHTHALKQ